MRQKPKVLADLFGAHSLSPKGSEERLVLRFDGSSRRVLSGNAQALTVLGYTETALATCDAAHLIEDPDGSFEQGWTLAQAGAPAPVECMLRP